MNRLHKSSYNDTKIIEPNEGQRGLLCSNKSSLRCPSLSLNKSLSKDTLEALEELGIVIRKINKRALREGYKLTDKNVYEKIKCI